MTQSVKDYVNDLLKEEGIELSGGVGLHVPEKTVTIEIPQVDHDTEADLGTILIRCDLWWSQAMRAIEWEVVEYTAISNGRTWKARSSELADALASRYFTSDRLQSYLDDDPAFAHVRQSAAMENALDRAWHQRNSF